MMQTTPDMGAAILWSFRRCPYAIRARLALAAADVEVEVREVNLAARPPELLERWPLATVPVLERLDGPPLTESLDVMSWALEQRDPQDWLRRAERGEAAGEQRRRIAALVAENDGPFKHHLERFKYANRYPGEDPCAHRQAALAILRRWNCQLQENAAGDGVGKGWLLGEQSCLADWALLPFVRQFRIADPAGFDATVGIGALQAWLARFEAGGELAAVMAPPLAPRHPWRSPSWLYHLALAEEWQQALAEGVYRRSTRGMSIEQVGYLHASHGDQIAATFERFYADAGPVRLLSIDPKRLVAAGLEVKEEAAPDSGELFPHVYGGPLPCEAVLVAEPYRP
jgi:glutathione S-transferase